ncbi:MAG: hypothetical protein VX879_05025, partial [Pseudomonadota bacterium]|nr:hypothetical protein [Pseudomonadota bacterium]
MPEFNTTKQVEIPVESDASINDHPTCDKKPKTSSFGPDHRSIWRPVICLLGTTASLDAWFNGICDNR